MGAGLVMSKALTIVEILIKHIHMFEDAGQEDKARVVTEMLRFEVLEIDKQMKRYKDGNGKRRNRTSNVITAK